MVAPCDGVSDCKLHAVGVVSTTVAFVGELLVTLALPWQLPSTTVAFVAELLVSDSQLSEKLLPPLPLPRQWPVVFMVISGT